MSTYDIAVIGGGAAGLTAALLLARSRRRVVVIDAGEPRNSPAEHVRGFLSRDDASPAELLEQGRAEVTAYGGELAGGRVAALTPDRAVRTEDGREYAARRVLVATGLGDQLPEIPGVAERWGRDLLHCPYCHGHEVADQPLAVLGTHPGAVHHALLLRQWSEQVTYLPHDQKLDDEQRTQLAARDVTVIEGEITGLLVEAGQLTGVALDGRTVSCAAAFLFPRMVPRDGFVDGLGCERNPQGFLATDPTGRTSVPWLWAAGNAADPRAQVVTAAGAGSTAGFAINVDLVQEDVALAVAERSAR